MKILDEWKLKRKFIKEGHLKEYEYYLSIKQNILNDIEIYKKHINKILCELERIDPNSERYATVKNELNRWKYNLEDRILQYEFIRPQLEEDIIYRNNLESHFKESIMTLLEGNKSLRFHGTTIYYAREILKSGCISSSNSRFDGYSKSTDMLDEISVTDVSTIDRTLSYFTDIYAYQRCLPCGCLFILKANENTDTELIKYSSMKSFNFREYPERFVGVCTSGENISILKTWLRDYGYDENLAYTFEQFLELSPTLVNDMKL